MSGILILKIQIILIFYHNTIRRFDNGVDIFICGRII